MLWCLPASTSVVNLRAFLQNALGAEDESLSVLEGQHELRPPLTHKWRCHILMADIESTNPWTVQASCVLS